MRSPRTRPPRLTNVTRRVLRLTPFGPLAVAFAFPLPEESTRQRSKRLLDRLALLRLVLWLASHYCIIILLLLTLCSRICLTVVLLTFMGSQG